MTQISSIVKEIIAGLLGVDESEVKEDVSFYDLGADSIDAVEIVMETEEQLDILIPDSKLESGPNTVGEFIKTVEEISKEQSWRKMI